MELEDTHWVTELPEFDINDWYGFIYRITNNINKMEYIGRKNFRMKKRVKVKGRKNCKITYTKSNWLKYTSSSTHVNFAIEEYGMSNFTFEIIDLCLTKGHLSFRETELQWKHEVLSAVFEDGSPKFYNKQIGAIKFRCDGHTEETKRKLSEASKGNTNSLGLVRSEETKEKISKANKGRKHTEEAKQKISEAGKGRTHTEETKKKMIEGSTDKIAIYMYNKDMTFICKYESMHEAERLTKVPAGNICNCCNNKRKTAGGFIWKYT